MKQFVMDGWITNGRIDRRQTATGKQVVSFGLNSPSRRKNQAGEWESVPQFFDCEYWGRSDRDFRCDLVQPGARLVVAGEPKYDEWQAQDGSKRSKVVFSVRDMWTVESGQQGQQRQQQPQAESVYEEDIPF